MAYILIAVHVCMIFIVRASWRRRHVIWTAFHTAECVVLPWVALLVWSLLLSLIPKAWLPPNHADPASSRLVFAVLTLPPLLGFWLWFIWSTSRQKAQDPVT